MDEPAREGTDEFDSPWKEALEHFFEPFMALLFPDAHAQIDWPRGIEFLDKELQAIAGDAELGLGVADKLVKVWTKAGEESWVVVHVEVQGARQKQFTERMYVYNYRTYDRHRRPVASLAILTDDHSNWRPDSFAYELFGCVASLKFPIIKLLDFKDRTAGTLESEHESVRRDSSRAPGNAQRAGIRRAFCRCGGSAKNSKVRRIQGMFSEGTLPCLLDWMMPLPDNYNRRLTETLRELKEENKCLSSRRTKR